MSYARHNASDKLFNKIIDHSDHFIEIYIGKYGRPKINKLDEKIILDNNSDIEIIKVIKDAIQFVKIDIPKIITKEDTDLLNILDDFLGDLNQTLYLYTLT
jgi:hypothetical protein